METFIYFGILLLSYHKWCEVYVYFFFNNEKYVYKYTINLINHIMNDVDL